MRFLARMWGWMFSFLVTKRAAQYALMRAAKKTEDPELSKLRVEVLVDDLETSQKMKGLNK